MALSVFYHDTSLTGHAGVCLAPPPAMVLPGPSGEEHYDIISSHVLRDSIDFVGDYSIPVLIGSGSRAPLTLSEKRHDYFDGFGPTQLAYTLRDDTRRTTFMGRLHNFWQALNMRTPLGNATQIVERSGEHGVLHTSLRGTATRESTKRVVLPFSTHHTYCGDYRWFAPRYLQTWSDINLSSSSRPIAENLTTQYIGESVFRNVWTLREDYERLNGVFRFQSPHGRNVQHDYQDINFHISDDQSWVLKYSYLQKLFWPGHSYDSVYHNDSLITVTTSGYCTGAVPVGEAPHFTVVGPAGRYQFTRSVTRPNSGRQNWSDDYYSDYSHTVTCTPMLLGDKPITVRQSGDGLPDLLKPDHYYRRDGVRYGVSPQQHFDDNVRADMDHLVPATFYSYLNAVEEFMSVVETNHIETISELNEMGAMLPSIKPLVHAAKVLDGSNPAFRWSTRRLKRAVPTTFAALLKFGTTAVLAKQFGMDPTANSIVEFADRYDNVVSRLRDESVFGGIALRGKFVYDLPREYAGFGRTVLTVRTKSFMQFSNTTLMTLILGTAALGIQPKLANFYEAIRLSFVLDWFTNLGTRINDAESQQYMFMMNHIMSVHSIAVESELDYKFLELNNLSRDGPILGGNADITANLPRHRYYYRYCSVLPPALATSRHDFRGSAGPPSTLTAGSLAYQFLDPLKRVIIS